MLIDATHRRWAIVSAGILAIALIVYVPYAASAARPSGGRAIGLAYGIAAFAAMMFVTLLSVRKKFPIWRIGRTQSWMRGHLWIGVLTLPLVLLHAAFSFGHGLTLALMWLLVIVYGSGVFGAAVQHLVPARMTRAIPLETIQDEIAHVRAQLVDEADTLVAEACGRLDVAAPVVASGAAALATVMRLEADEAAALRAFYVNEMRPFLQDPGRRDPLASAPQAAARFARLRPLVPPALHPALDDLESICDEERQLLSQDRYHRLLHGWLVVHVPLSFALMALAVIHIVMALRYR